MWVSVAEKLTAQNFLIFMQFFAKFGKIIYVGAPCRVGTPSYGESWIRPWVLSLMQTAMRDLRNVKSSYLRIGRVPCIDHYTGYRLTKDL